ncbi:MAG: pyrroline-5-carboxylate reductase [Thermococcaceae archaeon]|nr:pyrroline-5-carboxylate reductase [Thermococcaceae archaeon]
MRIAVIGAGMIGGAVAKALAEKGHEVIATRRNVEKAKWLEEYGVRVVRNNPEAADWAEVVFLAVKPNKVAKVLGEIRGALNGKILVSLAAGVPIKTLKELAPGAKVVRAMPNIAILVGEAFTGYSTTDLEPGEREKVESLLRTFGECLLVDEEHMDAITGLSGSGPAYVSVFVESMIYGGLRVGLPREVAKIAALQTLLGTAKLLMNYEGHPAEIRDMVTTPGGTTIDGIFELEEGKIRTAIMKAIDAATKKSRILSTRTLP